MLKSLEGSCFRQKIDLEPLIISPTTNFSLHVLTLSFKMSFSLSDSVISFQANFQIQIQKKRIKSYFSLNNLKTKVSLETVGSDWVLCLSLKSCYGMGAVVQWLSGTHLWMQVWNKLVLNHLHWCGIGGLHRGKLEWWPSTRYKNGFSLVISFLSATQHSNTPFFPYAHLKTCPHFYTGIPYAIKTQPLHS